jgi:hypothetical protein
MDDLTDKAEWQPIPAEAAAEGVEFRCVGCGATGASIQMRHVAVEPPARLPDLGVGQHRGHEHGPEPEPVAEDGDALLGFPGSGAIDDDELLGFGGTDREETMT